MAARGRKFSFMRLINNAIPNFARDDINDVDLTPTQADNIFLYQLLLPSPRYLDEKSFFVAGIVGSESLSRKVWKKLVKCGILLARPEKEGEGAGESLSGEMQMTVNTSGITKNFASQMAVISVHAQRKLVGMLFFWEEECTRWMLLDAEEKEILDALESNEGSRDLSVGLEAVGMKRKMVPSDRAEGTANVGSGRGHQLPVYG